MTIEIYYDQDAADLDDDGAGWAFDIPDSSTTLRFVCYEDAKLSKGPR